jgi:hypothetical protein
MRLLVAVVAVFFFSHTSVYPQEVSPEELCAPQGGYVVGFFNGVWNTEDDAAASLVVLQNRLGFGTFYRNTDEPIDYELFYNQTDREGIPGLDDLAEVFQQRALELDGALENRWEIFWEALAGASSEESFLESISRRIGRLVPATANLLSALYTDIVSKSVAGWSFLLTNPPTEEDLRIQRTRIESLAVERKKLLLIAHSQGNLFVNQAYDTALAVENFDARSIGVVHIAPASPTLRGNHVLADLDLVINGLRAFGLSTVPDITVSLPAIHLVEDDPTGHTLVATYLNLRRDPLQQVRGFATTALDALVTPETEGSEGFFTVTLTWNGNGDVDLHIFEPNGFHVYYPRRRGTSGLLDVDNVVANGPEHYFATCDPEQLQIGTYNFGINNFASATGRLATLQVSSPHTGELLTISLDVGSERGSSGDNAPIPVLSVTVTQDEEGRYSLSAQ